MRYLKDQTTHQIEMNKSKFIAILYPLQNIEDISLYLNEAKQAYPKASHYCNASLFGQTGEHATASDDGEPSRTAGVPILEVLKHHDVTNILCVVIRYFGGVKLGSGGLVRAYTKATADALKKAKFYQKKMVPSYEISFDYNLINQMDSYLEKKATVLEKEFLTHVTYKIVSLDDQYDIISDIEYQLLSYKKLNPQILYIDE
ncbi:MAG: YigZ family protein [Tenericutes bacterium]|nr:YigZ family protein [Mycoplasmatota bacterium]